MGSGYLSGDSSGHGVGVMEDSIGAHTEYLLTMRPGAGHGTTAAHMFIPIRESGDTRLRNERKSITNCTDAQSGNVKRREKDGEQKRNTTKDTRDSLTQRRGGALNLQNLNASSPGCNTFLRGFFGSARKLTIRPLQSERPPTDRLLIAKFAAIALAEQ